MLSPLLIPDARVFLRTSRELFSKPCLLCAGISGHAISFKTLEPSRYRMGISILIPSKISTRLGTFTPSNSGRPLLVAALKHPYQTSTRLPNVEASRIFRDVFGVER